MGDLRLRCVKVSGQSEVQDVLNQAFKVGKFIKPNSEQCHEKTGYKS